MPELPEVEVTRRGLLTKLPGNNIHSLWWSGKNLRTPIPFQLLKDVLTGNTFITIDRRAKYLLFRLQDGAVLVIHLGMTGKLSFLPFREPKDKHDHLSIRVDNEMELRFNDTRRFGNIALWPVKDAVKIEKAFSKNEGIEPLGKLFTPSRLQQLACDKKMPVKSFLMNTRFIAGIGNIYANEILFTAGINPWIPAGDLSGKQWADIVKQSIHTLQQAIHAGGTTISDFLGSNGQPGYFQLQLNLYGKKNRPCPRCATIILKESLGGRATFFCPTCQPVKTKQPIMGFATLRSHGP